MFSCSPFGNWEVDRLNKPAAIRLRRGLAAKKQIVDFVIDEVAVALEVFLVDVEARRGSEKPLEPGHAHDMGWRYGAIDWLLCDHD
jgi:hypothetical protein